MKKKALKKLTIEQEEQNKKYAQEEKKLKILIEKIQDDKNKSELKVKAADTGAHTLQNEIAQLKLKLQEKDDDFNKNQQYITTTDLELKKFASKK